MKAHVLHSQPVKQPAPFYGGLGLWDLASLLGPGLFKLPKKREDGFWNWDREGLGNPALGAWEGDRVEF